MREIPPTKPYFPEQDVERIKSDVERILRSGMLTLGDYTKEFETAFTRLCGVQHAVAVSSGTSALEIALRAMKLKQGDEVLVPTNTFTSTAATVVFAGGKLVFTDIDSESLCIDCDNVQKYMTSKTKGVAVVHIGGMVCPETEAVKELCEDHGMFMIEDAAHAQGSKWNRRPSGSLGEVGCFSFYPTKVMTTCEGGMITTNREDVAKIAKILRDQGKDSFLSNEIVELGYNWRMPEISAAIGLTQLAELESFVKRRNTIAQYYDKSLSKIDCIEPRRTPPQSTNNYYKYVAFLSSEIDRDDLKQRLRERGVRCSGEVYWPPLHLQPVYQRILGVRQGDFPVAEDVCKKMVCLPLYSDMTLSEAEQVTDTLQEVL